MSFVPRVLAISDGSGFAGREVGAWIQRMEAAGGDAVQLREKQSTARELVAMGRVLVSAASVTRVLVNGRADVALACGAAGVHLPSDGLPVEAVKGRFGESLAVGVSTHSEAEVALAGKAGADYVVLGPVYETPSKVGYGPPLGLDAVARACRLGVPVVAIGGVTIDRLEELAGVGASGVAAIRAIQDERSLEPFVERARELLGER